MNDNAAFAGIMFMLKIVGTAILICGIILGLIAASAVICFAGEPPRVQIVVLSAPAWCRPCVAAESDFKPWLQRSGWRVGAEATDHVRVIDCDCELELAEQFKPEAFPTFVVLRDGRETKRYIGYRGRRALVDDYMREWRK